MKTTFQSFSLVQPENDTVNHIFSKKLIFLTETDLAKCINHMKRYNLTNQFHGFHVIDYINHTNRNPGEAKAYNTKRKIKYNIKSNFVRGFQSSQ